MAMGSYTLGATVRIPLQVTESGIPFTEDIDPTIRQVIRPDGTSDNDFPDSMSELDQDYGAYFYDYTPGFTGDYVIIITYTVESVEFSVIENFTVKSASRAAPRAESR
jgi:hypothetical protein